MSPPYKQLLEAFADHLGLSPEEFLETTEIVIDSITVSLLHEPRDGAPDELGDVVYFSTLNVCPPADRGELHQAALEANMLWVGTNGFTLGLQGGTGAFTLCGRTPLAGLDENGLASRLNSFVDTAESWCDYIRARHVHAASAADHFDLFARV
jgi:hypothetical protein